MRIQEFFTVGGSEEEIIEIVKSEGFERVASWPTPTYELDGVLINIQHFGPDHIAANDYGFYLEMKRPLEEFGADHPLRNIFRKFSRPIACGMIGNPKYSITEYKGTPDDITISGEDVRDVAEGYANLAVLSNQLLQETRLDKRTALAETVIGEALPFYRRVLPEHLSHHPRQLVNPDALEETCLKILGG